MAERLLFGTVDRIIESLNSLAANEIGLLRGVQDELLGLMNTVSTIKAVLLDAEEKHALGNHAVRHWLEQLGDAIKDADDLLGAISTYLARDNKAKKVRIFFSESNQLVFRLKTARKIKAIRARLDEITLSFVPAGIVIGREKDKKAVIDLLMDSNVEENVSILPIVGIDGLGKTTLAQLVFNDDQIQKHFELKMWVCVSDIIDVKNIVTKIFESAIKKKPEALEMNTLLRYLLKEIEGKKYFLVLDDLCNEEWSDLKQVLMGSARGSRILVTTRNESVARITGKVEPYFLRGLGDQSSWFLFEQTAFEKGQKPDPRIIAIGREILAECSGVPLVIRTIGSLLRFKNSEPEWLSFKKELSKISQNDILPTLKLSYDHLLPSHLKHCFVYCSLFPKDYMIDKSTLIKLWIAQGF